MGWETDLKEKVIEAGCYTDVIEKLRLGLPYTSISRHLSGRGVHIPSRLIPDIFKEEILEPETPFDISDFPRVGDYVDIIVRAAKDGHCWEEIKEKMVREGHVPRNGDYFEVREICGKYGISLPTRKF